MRHNWRASLKKICRPKVLLIQFFPVALSVTFLLLDAKCNFASVLKDLIDKKLQKNCKQFNFFVIHF